MFSRRYPIINKTSANYGKIELENVNVSFDEKMLEWKKGARKEDGVWAKYWYKNIHNSTGFLPYAKKAITLTGSNAVLAEDCSPYYKFLTAKSIQL